MERIAKTVNIHQINWLCHVCLYALMPKRLIEPNLPKRNSVLLNLIRIRFVFYWIIYTLEVVDYPVLEFQVPCFVFNPIDFIQSSNHFILFQFQTNVKKKKGLICAAEHYDLPELLQACFHHAKQHLRIEIVCTMLVSLENYYWRYTSASELVNMILAFVETKAHTLFHLSDFLNISESMVQMIMCRNLEIPEVRKFEAMLAWAKYKVKQKSPAKVDVKHEFRCIMERLTRDLKLHRITPQELIKVVLPSKAIKNERILETLMYQANSGMYRIQDSYIEACQQRIKKQDSRYSEWESFDYGL